MLNQSAHFIAGVDEVGRGPLAGPVIAAAVILNPDKPIAGLKDSKQLSLKQREALASVIKRDALSYAIGRAEVLEIDQLNIFQASLLAMQRAVIALPIAAKHALIDGLYCPSALPCGAQAIVKGDQKIAEISAASIIAKVSRDQEMINWDKQYPGYGFAQHKGYPTKAHCQALVRLGVTPLHRRSFAPVKAVIEKVSGV